MHECDFDRLIRGNRRADQKARAIAKLREKIAANAMLAERALRKETQHG
jgi:hypothetical protein